MYTNIVLHQLNEVSIVIEKYVTEPGYCYLFCEQAVPSNTDICLSVM